MLAEKAQRKQNSSKVSKSFVIEKSRVATYTKPKDDHLSRSMNRSVSRHPGKDNADDPMNESAYLCNVCFGRDADAIFMDCGHGGLCMQCAYDIWKSSDECYMCRETIDYLVRYDNRDKKGDMFKILEVHQEV